MRHRIRAAVVAALAAIAGVLPASGLDLPQRVERYGRLEFKVPVSLRATNPYDPDQIRVDVWVTSPSGRALELPAFYCQDHDPIFNVARQTADWRARFTPEEEGQYRVEVFGSISGAEPQSLGQGSFLCVPSSRPGFIRVGRRPKDRLERSTGSGYFALGANICWGDPQNPAKYLDELDRLAESGATCVRVWTCPWWLPIEGRLDGKNERSLGRYNQESCALLDAILDRCEKRGLAVILCLEQFGNYQPPGREVGRWPQNPYNTAMGGPCPTTTSFFTDPAARDAFRKRLRYMVARFGHSTAIMAWELFNEVELVTFHQGTLSDNVAAVESWHREMAGFLQRTDPFGHLIATSSDSGLQRSLAAMGTVDVVMLHVLHQEDFALTVMDAVREVKAAVGVPVIVEEFGGDRADTGQVTFRRGAYAAVCAGAAGVLHWTQDVPDRKVVFSLIAPVRKVVESVSWRDEAFTPVVISDLAPRAKRAVRRFLPVTLPAVLSYDNSGPPAPAITVRPDGSTVNSRTMPMYLHGVSKPNLQRPIVLDVEFLYPGSVVVKVNTVSDQAQLEVDVDGEPVGKQELPTGRDNKLAKTARWNADHKIYQDLYDREFAFPVPAGKRQVRIMNTGKDWVQIDFIRLDNMRLEERTQVGATALVGRRAALAYVFGLNETWRSVQAGEAGKETRDVRFKLPGLPDAAYDIEALDPRSGEPLQQSRNMSRNGEMSLWTPPFAVDVFLRVTQAKP